MTNEDILEGQLKQVQGKIEDAYGDLTDDPKHDAAGKVKRVEGEVQEGVGHLEEASKNAARKAELESATRS